MKCIRTHWRVPLATLAASFLAAGGMAASDPPAAVGAGEGAHLQHVEPGGPAAKGGLKPGDVILGIDGKRIEGWPALWQEIKRSVPGRDIRLRYRRGRADREAALVVEGRYLPSREPPGQGLRTDTPAPVFARSDARSIVRVPGPKQVSLVLHPPGGAKGGGELEVRLAADRLSRTDFPARAGHTRQVLCVLDGSVEGQLGDDIALRVPGKVRLLWTERGGHVAVTLGSKARGSGIVSRWTGWGMFLWDPDLEQILDRPTSWILSPSWGLGTQGADSSSLVPPAGAASLGEGGARVIAVRPGWPAEKAGLAVGDLIESAGDRPLNHPADLRTIMENSFPNQRVRMQFLRGSDRRETTLVATAESIPAPPAPRQPAGPATPEPAVVQSGKRSTLVIRSPARLEIQTLLQRELSGSADQVEVEELPASGSRPRHLIYRLANDVEVRVEPGTVIQSRQPLRLIWAEHSPLMSLVVE